LYDLQIMAVEIEDWKLKTAPIVRLEILNKKLVVLVHFQAVRYCS